MKNNLRIDLFLRIGGRRSIYTDYTKTMTSSKTLFIYSMLAYMWRSREDITKRENQNDSMIKNNQWSLVPKKVNIPHMKIIEK